LLPPLENFRRKGLNWETSVAGFVLSSSARKGSCMRGLKATHPVTQHDGRDARKLFLNRER
jgi:hypothetical protein